MSEEVEFIIPLSLPLIPGQYTDRIDEKAINRMLKSTPSRRKGSSHLFRDMWNDGRVRWGGVSFGPTCTQGAYCITCNSSCTSSL